MNRDPTGTHVSKKNRVFLPLVGFVCYKNRYNKDYVVRRLGFLLTKPHVKGFSSYESL